MQVAVCNKALLKGILFSIGSLIGFNGFAQTITTYAGNRTAGYNGDGEAATATELSSPACLAINGGTLFFADGQNNRIRKVNQSGTVTTIAGIDDPGNDGNGGPATDAQLDNPEGMATDNQGNIYFSDKFNNCIRKISPKGIITSFAGNGQSGYSGDGGPAVEAQLNGPGGITVDRNGNLFIADIGNNRIRKVSPDGTITTIAGNGNDGFKGNNSPATAAELNGPKSVAVDTAGNVYIADALNYRVRKVTPQGMISTIAGNDTSGFSGDDDTAMLAKLNLPTGVAVDRGGNVYIADQGNNCIRKINKEGIISTVAGRGADSTNELTAPLCVVVDGNGILYVTEQQNQRIVRIVPAPPAQKVAKNTTKKLSTGTNTTGKTYTPPPFSTPSMPSAPMPRTSLYPIQTRNYSNPPPASTPTHNGGRYGG